MFIIVIFVVVLLLLVYIVPLVRTKTIKNIAVPVKHIGRIPMVLYRTNSSRTVPRSMYFECHEKWSSLNPDLSIIWFDNKEADEFMNKTSTNVQNAYKKLKPGAFKADLWRACVLYENGGIYTDSYCTPSCSLRSMFRDCINHHSKHQFISIKDRGNAIHQGFIACTPKHPFLKQYITDIVRNTDDNFYGNHDLAVTGPVCLNESIKKVVQTTRKQFREDWNMYGDLSFFLYKFVYGPHQNIYKGSSVVMSKKFSFIHFIYKKWICRGSTYTSMWQNRDIYN